jgi:hypothetical protein
VFVLLISASVQGRAMYRVYLKVFLMSITLVFSHASYAGKKQCQSYLDKLRNIQSQQKQGHSLKRGGSLNKQEAKARNKWWQCEQGHLKMAKKSKKKKPQNNKIVKQRSLTAKPLITISRVNVKPFQTSAPLVLKSRYQGKQLQAWLLYYQQSKKCLRPKTTKQFAFCVENRRAQQLTFEKIDAIVHIK